MTPIPEFAVSTMLEPFKGYLAKYGFVLWLAMVAAMMFGFKTFTPVTRIERLEAFADSARVERAILYEQNAAMIRWMCVKSTPKEISLSGLQCR